jgi:transposase
VVNEICDAKRRFSLPPSTPVISCCEAGRDGFWLHRFLASNKIENLIVDSASIEVNRRRRRAKSDNLDGTKLVGMLIRWHQQPGPKGNAQLCIQNNTMNLTDLAKSYHMNM